MVSKQSFRQTRSEVSMAAEDDEAANEIPTSQANMALISETLMPQNATVCPIRRNPLTTISLSMGLERYTMFFNLKMLTSSITFFIFS